MNKYLSIITLNINGLNALIKRHRVAEWVKKHDPHMYCQQETQKELHNTQGKNPSRRHKHYEHI